MVVAFFARFSQIRAVVLLISPERIELECCACAQIKALKRGIGGHTLMMLGIRHEKGETRQTGSVMVAFIAIFSQTGAMVLLISPKQIELESCACAQIKALEERNRLLHLDDAEDLSKTGRNAANLISDD